MDLKQLRRAVADDLAQLPTAAFEGLPTVMGFDGFVDNIIDVVDTRSARDAYSPLATIADFGARITRAAGHSANFELVVKQTKIGGNGPIMANALAALGHAVSYIGILGEGQLDPAFQPLAERAAAVYSLGNPASTDALEFRDGKLMFGKLEPLEQVSVENLRSVVGEDRLLQLFSAANCVATVNWTMLLSMNEIWDYLMAEILPRLTSSQRPRWFVDLADPAKRSREDLRQALQTLGKLQAHADIILGLNEAETRQVLEVCGSSWEGLSEDLGMAETSCRYLREHLGLSRVVCHMVKGAAGASKDESAGVEGFFEPHPKITTGAGDHFNAGYLWAIAAGQCERSALLIGTATSGHYVRTTHSPTKEDLITLLSAS
ncbi:MAG: carbohydrate kinase family protein [Planctomycetota bacterium]|nr:MAG: carbohydrate kinase family protein [Planctomycetota bacterium]